MKSIHLSQRHPSVTPLSYLHFRGFHPSNKTQDARNQQHVWISSYLFCPIQNRRRTYNWRPIFCSENIFENSRDCWLTVTIYSTPCCLWMGRKRESRSWRSLWDCCHSLSSLRCTVTAFMLIEGWENTSRSKNIQKIFSKTFDAHYPCVFYSRTMAPSPSVAMHYQSRGLEWILLQTNTYFNTLKSRCYFFRISHYLCVFQINQPYYFRSDSVVKCSI